jgi:hypothetical protein
MNSKTLRLVSASAFIGVCLGATSAIAAGQYASHPFLFRAKSDLTHAKYLLERASHDCGGHRVTALQKVEAALQEITTALQYADAHPQEDSKQLPGATK